jgi:hypothetical protein
MVDSLPERLPDELSFYCASIINRPQRLKIDAFTVSLNHNTIQYFPSCSIDRARVLWGLDC